MGYHLAIPAVRISVSHSYPVISFGPDHARGVAQADLSRKDVQRSFHGNARCPYGRYGPHDKSGFPAEWQKFFTHTFDVMVPLTSSPDEWQIFVAGGPGPQSLWLAHQTVVPPIKKREWEKGA